MRNVGLWAGNHGSWVTQMLIITTRTGDAGTTIAEPMTKLTQQVHMPGEHAVSPGARVCTTQAMCLARFFTVAVFR
jgi:hypothetical protein